MKEGVSLEEQIGDVSIIMEPVPGYGARTIDIAYLKNILISFFGTSDKKVKREIIEKILNDKGWFEHYRNIKTQRKVLSEGGTIEYAHELETAIKLASEDYDVLFVPKGMFARHEKKFDVFLLRDHILLRADLKTVISSSPLTIADRLVDGSRQSSRVVLDLRSNISSKVLIQSLRSSCHGNKLLKEVFLFYKGKFYGLSTNLIISRSIFQIIP